jgi:gluconolactonase
VTRANAIWRAPILADGTTTKVGLFIQLSGGIGPDGMAVDEEGGVVVAHVGLGVIWRFDSKGRPTHRIDAAVGERPTNIAFGGRDRRTLFITESTTGSILTARLPVAGKRVHF